MEDATIGGEGMTCPYCKNQERDHKRIFINTGSYMGWECIPFNWWDKLKQLVKERMKWSIYK